LLLQLSPTEKKKKKKEEEEDSDRRERFQENNNSGGCVWPMLRIPQLLLQLSNKLIRQLM